MELADSRVINASPEIVWAALLDPEVLKACIPGCQEMEGSVEDGFTAVVVQKIGPVKATFKGNVQLTDIVEGQSCKIVGEGKGGPAGFAKGGAVVTLAADDGGTLLTYDVDAKMGGKIAQLGSRIIDGVARKLADEFFQKFQNVVEGPEEDEVAADASEEEVVKKGFLSRFRKS
ncbi:CoxG family protein [Marivivens aquimaris]|uniref:CoxG family protein n=1 Tax=Marivivens aquimaris TaxID=2774876 RepID=UPI001882EFCB|nr:carbon monoxide dehydrogenase subunit G [Marivivens aquimaris]